MAHNGKTSPNWWAPWKAPLEEKNGPRTPSNLVLLGGTQNGNNSQICVALEEASGTNGKTHPNLVLTGFAGPGQHS